MPDEPRILADVLGSPAAPVTREPGAPAGRPLRLTVRGVLSGADILAYVQIAAASDWLSQPLVVDARQATFDPSNEEVCGGWLWRWSSCLERFAWDEQL